MSRFMDRYITRIMLVLLALSVATFWLVLTVQQ